MGDYNTGWTLVQRRGRRRPARPPFQDRRGGWTERAYAVPYGGRNQFPIPNRPVPPPTNSRYWGPQSRSYADVVRQDFRRPARRFFPPQSMGSEQIKRLPAGAQLKQLANKLHALIKMVHHLQNVAPKPGKEPPKMISKMVGILSTMIRPSSPTDVTLEMIKGNAENWGHTTQQILQQHYEEGLEKLLEEISKLLGKDWKEAFHLAVRWAKRNLARLTQEVIDHAEALITARCSGDNQPRGDTGDGTHRPHQPTATTATVATMTEGADQRRNQASQSAQAGTSREEDVPLVPETPPQIVDLRPPQGEAMEQRQHRRPRGVVFTEDLFLDLAEEREEMPPPPERQEDPTEGSALQDLEDLFGSTSWTQNQTSSLDKNVGTVEEITEAQVHHPAGEADDTAWESFEETTTPRQQLQRVTRHVNSERKMIDWGLSVRRKWLIIGDSNLSRMPPYDISDLQIDCYPGANFRHAEALMKKATSSVTVEKVVLSFGINHRNQKARETSVKQLQGAVRAARRKFPYAEVWVPLINFSSSLARDEQRTLRTLNGHIERNMPCLSALADREFHTEKDNVHWTKKTARAMLEHWVVLLNLTTL